MSRRRRWVARLSTAVSSRSRARKLAWLLERIEPDSSVLLVGASIPPSGGGTLHNVIEMGLAAHARAVALTYVAGDPRLEAEVVRGDACVLPFRDDSFDYVVSNAVIEHVGGPERAQSMLAESVRVARRAAFHTTPDRWFPVEVHTQVPLLHWLPRRWQARAFHAVGKKHWNTRYYWLYGRRSLKRLDARYEVERASVVSLVACWPARH